jgi:hypothetical protein
MSKNTFSVKSEMYVNLKRSRSVDGPWKPTIEEAVSAYAETVVRKELAKHLICRPFIAEKCDEKVAPAQDGRGVCYKTNQEATSTLKTQLARLGLHV